MSQLTEKTDEPTPNRLVTLKILIFLFFGALTNMYAFLPAHMEQLGFSLYDIRLITLIAALVSIIGPIIFGFVLDRVAVKRPSAYGKYLRILLFIFFILAGLAFGALLLVPSQVSPKEVAVDPNVTFSCNDNHAHVFIRKNKDDQCSNLVGMRGELKVFNCSYTCKTSDNFRTLYAQLQTDKVLQFEKLQDLASIQSAENSEYDENLDYDDALPQPEALIQAPTEKPLIQPPHVCLQAKTEEDKTNCFVYLDGNVLKLPDRVGGENDENHTVIFQDEYCIHPLENTICQIPGNQIDWMNFLHLHKNVTCAVTTECMIEDPFSKNSILRSVSRDRFDEVPLQFDLYVTLRIIAELFPVVIHMLLNIAIIIATRETSVGRGNVGHQWVFYPFGVLFFATVIGLINHAISIEQHVVPIIVFSVTMFVCAVVVLLSGKLPLTPSDWFWHTKCGMLAIPMSALKRYKWVITAIVIVAFILGSLWHIIEPIRHLFSKDIFEYEIISETDIWRSKTFVYIIGSFLAVPLIWNGEKAVDLIGHSNIFILAFVSFALRFAGYYFDCRTYVTSAFELLEPISFYLPWLALILFTRHLIPKKFLAIGQGLLVVLFFSLGRAVGFFYGTSIIADDRENRYIFENTSQADEAEKNDFQTIHTVAASVACITAILYFLVYHCILIPCYRVSVNRLANNSDSNLSPQRVFHDERSRKGYFRY